MPPRPRALLGALILALAACRTGVNYQDRDLPRYARATPESAPRGRESIHALRVASFNVERALRVDTAIQVIQSEPDLRDADIVLLQEMNDAGTQKVATALGMGYVYYPGTLSLKTHRDFG